MLIGLVLIGITIPLNNSTVNNVEAVNIDLFTVVSRGQIDSTKFFTLKENMINQQLNNFIIFLKAKVLINNTFSNVTYIGLSTDLLAKFNMNTNEVYANSKLSSIDDQIKLIDNSTINFLPTNIENNDVYRDIIITESIFTDLDFIQPDIMYGTIELGWEIVSKNSVDIDQVNVMIASTFPDGWTKQKSIDELRDYIANYQKIILDELIIYAIKNTEIYFNSMVSNEIDAYDRFIEEQVIIIQILSIPNLLIALAIFSLLFQETKEHKEKSRLLWTRGMSIRKIQQLLLIIEFINLIISILSAIFFSSLVILTFGSLFDFKIIIDVFLLLFIAIASIKAYQIISVSPIENPKIEKHGKNDTKIFRIKIAKIAITITFAVNLLMTFILPKVVFPIFNNKINQIIDMAGLIIISLGFIVLLKPDIQHKQQSLYDVKPLVTRLFNRGIRKFNRQRVITLSLFALIIFLITAQTGQNYLDDALTSETPIGDFNINKIEGYFGNTDLLNLNKNVATIDRVVPFSHGYGALIQEQKTYSDINFNFIDKTFYSLPENSRWNHALGEDYFEDLVQKLTSENLIISQELATQGVFRKGDQIDISIDFEDSSTHVTETIIIKNLEIIGIIDEFPIINEFISGIILSHDLFNELLSNKNYKPGANGFIVKLKPEISSNSDILDKTIEDTLASLKLTENDVSISKPSDTFIEKNPSINLFITLDLIFVLFILPIAYVIFGQIGLDHIKAELKQLGTRGLSDIYLRKKYTSEIFRKLIEAIYIGNIIGLNLGIIYLKNNIPYGLLLNGLNLQFSIFTTISLTVIGGLVGGQIVNIVLGRKIQTITKDNATMYLNEKTRRK